MAIIYLMSLSLRLDSVQRRLASVITTEIETLLEAPIGIESIRIIHLDKIILKNIALRDSVGDTIISVKEATAHISPYELLKKRIQINTLALASPDIKIYRTTSQSPLNIQFIIDKLKKEENEDNPKLALRINQMLIYDGKFRYDINEAPVLQERFDPSHIAVENIDCNVSMKKFIDDELELLIRSIKGDEKSGLQLRKLKTGIRANKGKVELDEISILTSNSTILSDSIIISFDKENPKAFEIVGNINSDKFTITDYAPLFKNIPQGIPTLAFNIATHSNSAVSRTVISARSIDDNIALKATASIDRPFDKERSANICLNNLHLTKEGVTLLQSFTKANTIDFAEKLGECTIKGEAEATSKKLSGNFTLNTASGEIHAGATVSDNGVFDIEINGNDINIGRLADIDEALTCSLNTKANGCFNNKDKNICLDGCITQLKSSKYSYSPIEFRSEYDINKNAMTAGIETKDPGLTAKASLNYSKKDSHRFILSLDVDSITPSKIGLNDSIKETFAFNFDSELTFSNKHNSILNVKMQNFTYSKGDERRTIKNLHFCDNRNEEQRLTMINSDFIDFSIIGQYDYKSMLESIQKSITKHTPSLFSHKGQRTNENCNYIFKCDIKDSHFVSELFKLPVTINKQSSINGACNDKKGLLTINLMLNDVKINKNKFGTIGFTGESKAEDFTINSYIVMPVKKQSNDNIRIDFYSKLFNDTLQNSLNWSNNKNIRKIEGRLNLETALSKDKDGKFFIKSSIRPDSIIQNDSVWYISGSTVSGNTERININGLYLYNDHQHLRLNGDVGKEKDDVLNISAKNLEVSTILDLVKFRILKFNGNATGSAQASSLLSKPDVNGNFKVDSFKIDNGYLGSTDLNIGWRSSDKSIFLNADIHNDAGKQSHVNGFLSQANDTIHLDIEADELNANFINKMVRSFMSDIEGTGSGKVSLLGSWRKVDLIGAVALNCSARIKPTKVKYTFHGDSLHFTRGKLTFKDAHVTDKRGNSGWLSGEVTHKHLGKWECDLSARVNNMLVYDTHNFDEAPFYGTVYATGSANLKANSKGLFIKAEVRNEQNSRIVYNSSGSGSVRDNSFVKFIDSSKKQAEEKTEENNISKYNDIESSLNLDFYIDVNEGLQVKVYTNLKSDDYIDIYGKGAINAIYDEKEGFSLKGNLDLDRGAYKITVQDIFTKEFSIAKGSTLIFNGNPYDANLDIKAKYLVPSASLSALNPEMANRKSVKVNCLMNMTGTLASPILNFDLELPEGSEEEKEMLASATSTPEQKNMQFIYLLGIGKFYTYDYSNSLGTAGTQNNTNTTAVESLISNTLSGQINNMLGQIIDNGNWNISGNFSTSERGWNSMEVEGMLEGRLLNDRLLINGNLGYRENPVANRNVIGDFELQLLLNRKGNISLRAYSKTNDRYFSKTNLTTQGAGIILRHDFNYWKWWKKDDEDKEEKKEKRVKKKRNKK